MLLLLILFVLLPVLTLPLVLLAYIRSNRHTSLYSLMLGLGAGITAFHLKPPIGFDLYRHHEYINSIMNMNFAEYRSLLGVATEPITFTINYAISRLGNPNYIQLFVAALGYWILFYIIRDYSKRKNLNSSALLLVIIFTISAFSYVIFVSGLWNYLAMLIFTFGFYREYVQKKGKQTSYLMYIASILVHNSMLLPVFLLVVYKLAGEKLNKRLILIIVVTSLLLTYIGPIIIYLSGFAPLSQLDNLYVSYFLDTTKSRFYSLYGGHMLVMELLKLVVFAGLIHALSRLKDLDTVKIRDYLILLIGSIAVLAPISIVALRFVTLVLFLASLLLISYYGGQNHQPEQSFTAILIALSILFIAFQLNTIIKLDFGYLMPSGMLTSIITLGGH